MRQIVLLTVILICISCKEQHAAENAIKLPEQSTVREVKLIDSLGLISMAIPNRYDTFFKFGYEPGCGLPVEMQLYKFQRKSLGVFEESGMINPAEPKIKDQLVISHRSYNASDTTDDSTIMHKYHLRRKNDIMMSPYHGIIEKAFVGETESGFQSTFVMNLEDTTRSVFRKEVITSMLKKKNIIVFDFLYVSNKKDAIATGFIKNALESVKTIKTNNSY